MADQLLKPGDVVQLKSGGERMTVESVVEQFGSPVVNCVWFDSKKVMREQFRADVLAIY